MQDRDSQDFEAWYRSLSDAEQELVLLRLRKAVYALLSSQPPGKWQRLRAVFLGVKLTEFDPN